MNLHARVVVATVTLLTLLGAAAAQADGLQIRANIPFGFTAGATTLPAGAYSLTRLAGNPRVFLVRGTGPRSVFLMSQGLESGNPQDQTRLVFHRYGNQYFLREVWLDGSRGHKLPETRQEREAKQDRRNASAESRVVAVLAALQ